MLRTVLAMPDTKPKESTMTMNIIDADLCVATDCDNPRPPKKATGPRGKYCSNVCKQRERYRRDRANGVVVTIPGSTERPERRKYLPGHIVGDLTLVRYVERSRAGESRGLWRCSCGSEVIKQVNNVVSAITTTCAGPLHRRGESVTYSTAHGRVRADRGPANDHLCVLCQKPARDWAYFHADPEAVVELDGKEKGRAYSTDPRQYVPLCRSCHVKADRAHDRLGYGPVPSLVHRAVLDLANA